jgi:hypothetical protein
MKNLSIILAGPILIILSILLFFNAPSLTEGSQYKAGYTLIFIVFAMGLFAPFFAKETSWGKRVGVGVIIMCILFGLLILSFLQGLSELEF